jgi:hypothetical protein
MSKATWKVVGRVFRRFDGKWCKTSSFGSSPEGSTSLEAAQKWSETASLNDRTPTFLAVEFNCPLGGRLEVIVKVKPRVVFDCELEVNPHMAPKEV